MFSRLCLTLVCLSLLLAAATSCSIADSISGHVTGPTGTPVAYATVYYFDQGLGLHPAKLTTDSTGDFTAQTANTIGHNYLACMIDAKGLAPGGGNLLAGTVNQFQLSMPVVIKGTVVDETGKPVAGAKVSAQWATTPQDPGADSKVQRWSFLAIPPLADRYSVTTDADGVYSVSDLPQNSVVSLLLHDSQFVDTTVVTDKGALTAPKLVARPGASVTGRVVFKGGAPAAGLTVLAHASAAGGAWNATSGITGADGSYKIFGLIAGTYNINVDVSNSADSIKEAWVAPADVIFAGSLGTPATAPDLILTHGGIVTGTIIDSETKAPVAGVMVGVQFPQVAGQSYSSTSATTDALGRYSFHVRPGTDSFFISQAPDDYASNGADTQKSFTIAEGQTVALDPIAIRRAITISAMVVDDSGSPVPALALRPQLADNSDGWMNLPQDTSDTNGRITFHQLLPGSYALDPGDAWIVVSPATITAPTADTSKIVVKKRLVTTLIGHVLDLSGAPVPNADLTFTVDRPISNGSLYGNEFQSTTGKDGAFTLANAPVDTTMIQFSSVTKDGYIMQTGGTISKTGDQLSISAIIMAQLGGKVDGVVRNSLNLPVPGAWVICSEAGKDNQPVQTDTAGQFKLTGLIVGSADLYAAKGSEFGHKLLQTTLTPVAASISLNPPDAPQPAPADVGRCTNLLYNVQSIGNGTNGLDAGWRRQLCADELASNDPEDGLDFLENYNPDVDNGAIRQLINARSAIDPLAAEKWGVPEIQAMQDGDDRSGAALDLGLAIVPYDSANAVMLYDLARKQIDLAQIDESSVYNAMNLTALAAALDRPEADDLYAKTMAAVGTIIKNAKPQPGGYSEADWLPQNLAQVLALGSVTLAEQVLATMPERKRHDATPQIVSELVARNPAGALKMFHTLDDDKDSRTEGDYNQAAGMVFPVLCKSDLKAALALADTVTDPQQQAQELLTAADSLPMLQAIPLYCKAETESADQGGHGATPACIAAHAWTRNKTIGAQLFREAYDKVIAGAGNSQPWQGPSYAEFAFYYSRLDPGFSRLLLEKQFAEDQGGTGQQGMNGSTVLADASAMAAIDTSRALVMAQSIKDPYSSFMAALKVAQYVLATQPVRDSLPFDRWSASDTWTPGTPTGW